MKNNNCGLCSQGGAGAGMPDQMGVRKGFPEVMLGSQLGGES